MHVILLYAELKCRFVKLVLLPVQLLLAQHRDKYWGPDDLMRETGLMLTNELQESNRTSNRLDT